MVKCGDDVYSGVHVVLLHQGNREIPVCGFGVFELCADLVTRVDLAARIVDLDTAALLLHLSEVGILGWGGPAAPCGIPELGYCC